MGGELAESEIVRAHAEIKAVVIYNRAKIEFVYRRSRVHFSCYVNEILYVYDEIEGLMQVIANSLFRVTDCPCFPDNRNFNLSRVGHLTLDLLREVE